MRFRFDCGVKLPEFSIIQMASMFDGGKKCHERMLLVEAVKNDSATYRRVGLSSCSYPRIIWPEERRVITII